MKGRFHFVDKCCYRACTSSFKALSCTKRILSVDSRTKLASKNFFFFVNCRTSATQLQSIEPKYPVLSMAAYVNLNILALVSLLK